MGESARDSGKGRKRSKQSRSPPVGSQTNEKRKIVGQVSSHPRSLKTRREKNKIRRGGEKYEESKKGNGRGSKSPRE